MGQARKTLCMGLRQDRPLSPPVQRLSYLTPTPHSSDHQYSWVHFPPGAQVLKGFWAMPAPQDCLHIEPQTEWLNIRVSWFCRLELRGQSIDRAALPPNPLWNTSLPLLASKWPSFRTPGLDCLLPSNLCLCMALSLSLCFLLCCFSPCAHMHEYTVRNMWTSEDDPRSPIPPSTLQGLSCLSLCWIPQARRPAMLLRLPLFLPPISSQACWDYSISTLLHDFQESESELFGLRGKHFHPLSCSHEDTNRIGLRATPTVVGTHLTWLQLQRDPLPRK